MSARRVVRGLAALLLVPGIVSCSDQEQVAAPTVAVTPSVAGLVHPAPEPTPSALASATPSAAPRPTASRSTVTLSTSGVAGVPFGTPDKEAERRLRRALGLPRSEALPDCNGIRGRTLTWGSLAVVLSNEAGGDVVLVGWTVDAEARPRFGYEPPYGVQVGTPMRTVLEKVPRSEGYAVEEGPFTGDYFVRTSEEPYVFWTSRQGDGSGRVDDISFRTQSLECD